MVEQAIGYASHMYCIDLQAAGTLVPMNGDCLFSSAALSLNPSLRGDQLQMEAISLRRRLILNAISSLDTLEAEKFEWLQMTANLRVEATRDTVKQGLIRFLENGQFDGDLGDVLPYIVSSFLGAPLLIIKVDTSVSQQHSACWIGPMHLFCRPLLSNEPIVLVSSADHYEVLLVPGEREKDNLMAEYHKYQEEIQKIRLTPVDDRSPTTRRVVQASVSTVPTDKKRASIGIGIVREDPCSDISTWDEGDVRSLQVPDETKGNRKLVKKILHTLAPPKQRRLSDLLQKLDQVYVDCPHDIERMKRNEQDIKEVLEIVEQSVKYSNGELFRIEVTDMGGAARESSSVVIYKRTIGNKILPFLRQHHSRGDFRVTDLFAFGESRLTRVHVEMVIKCNQKVGRTASSKKIILNSWQQLCKAIIFRARQCVEIIGDEKLSNIKIWYNDLVTDIAKGMNQMDAFTSRAYLEKKHIQEEDLDYMPMDKAIMKYIESDMRKQLLEDLLSLSAKISSTVAQAEVSITKAAYLQFSQLVQTELSIYLPVRIGAIGRLKFNAFARCQPEWSTDRSTEDHDKNRPTNIPPSQACQHQTAREANALARTGFKENGEPCCQDSVPPECFFIPNEQDKGRTVNSWLAISREGFRLMCAFLVIRWQFFKLIQTSCHKVLPDNGFIFLSAKGKEPRETSDFKLNLFNRIVKSRKNITPQDLRKWNTTFLNHHPDPCVQAIRGTVTGNSDTVFNQTYNLSRTQAIVDGYMACFRRHRADLPTAGLDVNYLRIKQIERRGKDVADKAALSQDEDPVDLTHSHRPVHRHLRNTTRVGLERHCPGLWKSAGTHFSKKVWIKKVVEILGDNNLQEIRESILLQYRGCTDPEKRRWSGARTHLEQRKKTKDEEISNCPLYATLMQFYSSAIAYNKHHETGSSDEE